MNASQIFIKGHRVARTTRDSFDTYRLALSSALKGIYKELKEAEERKAARKTAWNLQEEKRKKVSEKRLEAMNKIRAELNQNDSNNSIHQQVAEAAFREDERFKKVGIDIRYW
jgi:hypothetical protein